MVCVGLTSSFCFLSDLSLPSTSWLSIVVIGIGIVKVWISKGMISKLVPPLGGLTSLVTSCTMDGIVRILITSSNFHIHKTRWFILKIKENSMVGL